MNEEPKIEQSGRTVSLDDPEAVAVFLSDYYKKKSKESLKGFTPNPDLAEYWRKVAAKARSIGQVKR